MFLQVCVCPQGGGGGGIPACIAGGIPACLGAGLRGEGGVGLGVSQHTLQVSRPTHAGEVEGDLARRSPGPHPRGKLRGIWPGGSPGPHPGEGGVSRPTPGGVSALGGCVLQGGACSRGCGDPP